MVEATEGGRRSKKRKAKKVLWQQDYHWEGGNMQEEGKKKQQKKKKKEKKEQKKQRDDSYAVLKQKRKEKKPKTFGPFAEEGEERPNGISVCSEQVLEVKKKSKHVAHSLCKLKEHGQAQEDSHVDEDVYFDGSKRQCKKVRFSDQLAPCKCKWDVAQFVSKSKCSVSKEPSANGCAEQANFTVSCSCNSKEMPSQNGSMNSNAGRRAVDENSNFTHKRQKVEDDEIWGKRFTPEEDELLKNAILEYIKVNAWGEKEGIDKVLNCRKHKEAYNCWGVLRLCLPQRPRRAIRSRAHRLFGEHTHIGHWSKEEEELLKRLHQEHGNQWKNLSTIIGRSQFSISEKWRILRRPSTTGVWTWDEVQQLSDLVHKCLRLKVLGVAQRGEGSHKILRDNIRWNDIADAIGTHNHGSCCTKWYNNLSSSMVIDGLWASEDDRVLLKSILESGACTEEEVEWHRLLNHRSGQVCLVRWKQMVKHLGENRTRGFLEKLDSLVRRYAPELRSHGMEDCDETY